MVPFRRTLTDTERLDWLRLARTENVGPVTFFRLLERFRDIGPVLDTLPEMARRGGAGKGSAPQIPDRAAIEREYKALAAWGGQMVAACEPGYPELLAAIPDPPPLLSVAGRTDLLHRTAIGVVGARNASLNGQRFAEKLAAELGEAGITVVSGLARGIDTAAHRGALESGTVGVVAGGVDVVYPPENRKLYDQMREKGAVVAELAFGAEPQARHFPRRNRVISGLSRGIVVVEAALHSGSLITARLATEQGRDVFAVPGSPLDARCRGTNDLIRQGATLVEIARDVLDALGPGLAQPDRRNPGVPEDADTPSLFSDDDTDRARQDILQLLGPSPVSVDGIVRASGMAPGLVSSILLELELAGRLQRMAGSMVAIISPPP
ncbi:MAG: DNA-processing protein DprA [Pseudomonadota bacterium]|nr:DNA-processing protein DprA [Pseudomonadota bacterium]